MNVKGARATTKSRLHICIFVAHEIFASGNIVGTIGNGDTYSGAPLQLQKVQESSVFERRFSQGYSAGNPE